MLEWQENDRSRVQLLPEAGLEAQTCYIRLDGLPGFWFSPTLRTPQDATTNWGGLAHTGATLALGVVMLLCLLRGFTEKGQWRIWTSLYVAVALAQSILGMPVIADGRIPMNEAAAALAPGVALMLLPHVARISWIRAVRRGPWMCSICCSLCRASLWHWFPCCLTSPG